ncbi:MAG: hypothetical protein ACXVPU_11920 [Bacteroidia bacterium]
MMRRLFLIFFLLHCSCIICVAQKSVIEELKPGETLTMQVSVNSSSYTDPTEFYVIQLVKVDSTCAFSYVYRGKQTKKKIGQVELNSIIDFEKNAPDKHAGLNYDEVIIKWGRKQKRFITKPDADVVFLKKIGIL